MTDNLKPCPFAIGDKVLVVADELPASYRENWRGVEAHVVAIKYDEAMPDDYDVTISERWPPQADSDFVDGFAIEQLAPLTSLPTVSVEARNAVIEGADWFKGEVDCDGEPLIPVERAVALVEAIEPPADPHSNGWLLGFCRARKMAVEALKSLPTPPEETP